MNTQLAKLQVRIGWKCGDYGGSEKTKGSFELQFGLLALRGEISIICGSANRRLNWVLHLNRSQVGMLPSEESEVVVCKSAAKTSRPPLQLYRPPYLRKKEAMTKSLENLSGKSVDNLPPSSGDNGERDKEPRPLPVIVRRSKPVNRQNRLSVPSFHGLAFSAGGTEARLHSGLSRAPSGLKRTPDMAPKESNRKKELSEAEFKRAEETFASLQMLNDKNVVAWLASKCSSSEQAASIAQVLVQLAIEGGKPKSVVAKLCHLLLNCPSHQEFHNGLLAGCNQYFDRREKLRQEYCTYWLEFMSFLSELCTDAVFTSQDQLAGIVFAVFNYLLSAPVLETIKMEELECVISSLLNVGYSLERQYPDRLTDLRNTFRNSFIQAKEPWVRKMILLLIELSAGSWRLSDNASRYYYQTTSGAV
uniref:MIF4G domain-containing protein n=1 Tax=Trichuris muris TaxID=70415 RepID=A0A5S6R3L4_TRIMR